MSGACEGLRVLDVSQGMSGPLATMVLADFGADVVHLELPGDDDVLRTASSRLLLERGKRSIELDLETPEGVAELHRIIPGFDVAVVSLPRAEAERLGLGDEQLRTLNPALVYCAITGFGPEGQLSALRPYDGLVMAKAGVFRDQAGWHSQKGEPVFRACRDGSYFAAMLALQGVLAALIARRSTGEGQLVEVTMLQALSCRQNPSVRWLLREGEEIPSENSPAAALQNEANLLPHHRNPREVTLLGPRVECADGRYLVHSHSEPHFFPAWIEAIGFSWIWDDDRFKGAPYKFEDPAHRAELLELIVARMKEKTSTEWIEIYVANGNVCGDIVQTTQEAIHNPQVEAAGFAVDIDDPRVGTIREIGALAQLPGAPAEIGRPAPERGEHTAEVLAEPVVARQVAPTGDADLSRGPLSDVIIVEAAYYYATPFAMSLLADLGARVIKIEPLRGDPYRALSHGTSSDPVLNLGHNNMVKAMQGKESIALNLKDERGRTVLNELVERSNLFVHSFRAKAATSLGLDEASLRAANPDLVYQYGASYGSTGPYAGQPAIDPVIAAFSGTTAYQGGEGNPPLTETGADPIAAAGHAAATLIGLYAHLQTGDGLYLESAMIASNIYANCEDALSYDGVGLRPTVTHRQLGTGATYRLYRTAPVGPEFQPTQHQNAAPQWVFLAVVADDEFDRFCALAGRPDLSSDPRFATRAAREEHSKVLEDVLEELMLTRSAPEWEATMVPEGVGCIGADAMRHFAFLYEDETAKQLEIMVPTEHPTFGGRYWRHAPLVRLSDTPGTPRTFCELGEHTRALLHEIGYGEEQIAELWHEGVVGWPADEAAQVTAAST
jgi:crotonobetainyl-CoA:carnitine CoA-transferase CaiB-like acyl-CoA transferase